MLAPVDAAEFAPWAGARVRHRGREYEALKATLRDALLAVLFDQFPAARPRLAFAELGTPLSQNFYLGSVAGEVYGLDHDVARFSPAAQRALHPDPGVPGLVLAGQDIVTNGVAGAYLSAILATSHVSKLALLRSAPELAADAARFAAEVLAALCGALLALAAHSLGWGRAPPRAKSAEATAS